MALAESVQLLQSIPGSGASIAVVLMAFATVAGAAVARRSAGQAALVLAVASGVMLATAVLDLLPEAWHDGTEAGVSVWVLALTAVGGYLVMAAATRNGCGCDADSDARVIGAHAPGLHRRVSRAAGALSVGLGAAIALGSHRVIEGTALALAFSLPVVLTLVIASASDGLALAALLRESRQPLGPWLVPACASPALGVLVTVLYPLPPVVLPVALALVAGVILRIAAIGLRLAVQRWKKGQLPHWHVATAVISTFTMGAFLLTTH